MGRGWGEIRNTIGAQQVNEKEGVRQIFKCPTVSSTIQCRI